MGKANVDEELEFLDQLVRKIWETPHINIDNIDHGPDPTIAGRPSLDVLFGGRSGLPGRIHVSGCHLC